ncbi:MAG: RidA family protein [Candidatus Krumholzibacteriia bacterium]
MDRTIIQTNRAPAAIGPYSQGVQAGGWVFTAGQIPLDPATGELVGTTAPEQTRQCLLNARAIIEAGGLSLATVVKATVFIRDMGQFAAINEVYREFFPDEPPARSVVEVCRLPKDALVEIELVAFGG